LIYEASFMHNNKEPLPSKRARGSLQSWLDNINSENND